MPDYYPLMLDIRDRLGIVVGGDAIAAEKARVLSSCGARVRVLGLEFCVELQVLAERGQVTLCQKVYESGDLAEAFVVVAVTTDPQVIQTLWQETYQRGQLLNIVDVPKYCSFILPSVLRRGQLTIAVSTEGASPSLSKRIRQQLEDIFPPVYGEYIELAALARSYLRQHGVSYLRRDAFFQDFMASSVLANMGTGEVEQALTVTADLLRMYGVEVPLQELIDEFRKD